MRTVTVMEVGKGPLVRQFLDLPVAVGDFPPGADWLLAAQRRRLRRGCPPQEGAAAALLLAHRAGRPVGRITAHVSEPGTEAHFGFMVVEGAGDAEVTAALLAGAARWAEERGRTIVVGPMSWGPQQEAGVLVAGHDSLLVTGRAWTPPWYGDLLAGAGLEPLEELRSYRLAAGGAGPAGTGLRARAPLAVPGEMAPMWTMSSFVGCRRRGRGGAGTDAWELPRQEFFFRDDLHLPRRLHRLCEGPMSSRKRHVVADSLMTGDERTRRAAPTALAATGIASDQIWWDRLARSPEGDRCATQPG